MQRMRRRPQNKRRRRVHSIVEENAKAEDTSDEILLTNATDKATKPIETTTMSAVKDSRWKATYKSPSNGGKEHVLSRG